MIENSSLEDWKKCREIGERNFISIYGLLYFGSCMFVFFLLKGEASELKSILFALILCSLSGLLFGKLVWFFNEKKFSKKMPPILDVPSFFIALKEAAAFIKRKFDSDHYEGYTYLGEKVSYGGWLYSRVDGGPDRRYHNNKRWIVSIKSWRHLETGEVKTKKSEGFSSSYGDLR